MSEGTDPRAQGATEEQQREARNEARSMAQELPAYDQQRLESSGHSLDYLATPARAEARSEGGAPRPNRYFEGISSNATKLGISVGDLLGVDAQSPFTVASSEGAEDRGTIPESLVPTSIQRQIPHHPFFDCIPIVSLRDRAILACATDPPLVNRFDICYDMFAGGLTFQDDPGVEANWRYSDDFRTKWTGLLQMDTAALLRHVERTRPELSIERG